MNGYTLIEMIVIITIISLLAVLVLSAWPKIREHQGVLLAQQQIQSLLRKAQQKALHEERTEDCLKLFAENGTELKRCSNIGVAVRQQDMLLFADTSGSNNQYTSGDLILEEQKLLGGAYIDEGGWHSFLFSATPPRIFLYDAGTIVTASSPGHLTISFGQRGKEFKVLPYGQVEQ